MKETQKCSKETKMKVKNEDSTAVAAEKENQVCSFEKKNNLSAETMTKEETTEQEVKSKGGDEEESTSSEAAEPVDNLTKQMEDFKISKDDLGDLTSKISDIQISEKKKEDTSGEGQKVERQNTVEDDGKPNNGELVARGPNGGQPIHRSSYDNNCNLQSERKCIGTNKRSYSEETEPSKFYKPVNDFSMVNNQMSQVMTFQNVDQFTGGTVNVKQSPIIQQSNIDAFKLDGADAILDALWDSDPQNSFSGTEYQCNIPVSLGQNVFPQTSKEDNVLEAGSPYHNPPSNQSDNDSGISGMSVHSPYQKDMYSPQSQKSNTSPPHEFGQDISYTPMNIIQTPTATDLLAGREEELSDALDIIKDQILLESRPRRTKEVPIQKPEMAPKQINMMPQISQPFPQMNHGPIYQFSQQPAIFGNAPVTSNQVIMSQPSMMTSAQPSAVVHPIPVSTCGNPVMMVPPTQGAIPVGLGPPYSQPQIIIIQQGPAQAPRKPALRNIAPKTLKPDGKGQHPNTTGSKGQGQVQKQVPRSDPVPVMPVKPQVSPTMQPNNRCVQQQQQYVPNNANNINAKRNNLNVARRMVAEIPREQLAYQDDEGDTYLHVAACKTDANLIQALLERLLRENLELLIDMEDKKRMTPLYLAVLGNQPEMVDVFLKHGANPNSMAQSVSSDGKTMEVKAPIHVAASKGEESLPTLRKLLSIRDITLNIANSEGHTALHTAIIAHGTRKSDGSYINSMNTIEALIKAGADPNSQDKKSGKTPLMYAIEKRDYILIDKMLRLFDPKKLRNVIKSQTFDGSNCLKIAEGRKAEFNPQDWQRLWDLLNKACTGELPRPMLGAY